MEAELQRDVEAIAALKILPTILDVVCRSTGMRFAAVARVTEDRWIACGVRDEIDLGLKPGGELKVETTLCQSVHMQRKPIVIDNVAEDPVYCRHPTPAMYGFQSYISMPIVLTDSTFFGTLCALDPLPRTLNNSETISMFQMFADLIASHLDGFRRFSFGHARLMDTQGALATSEANLADARDTADLREQFIAVLGHDLRNPLAAVTAGVHLLRKTPLNERAVQVTALMEQSVKRMSDLIENLMDFARGRLGGGLNLERQNREDCERALRQVIDELQATSEGRKIEVNFDLPRQLNCDGRRIGQLLSNLLGNALTHGATDGSVVVRATSGSGEFVLSVSNAGEPIPPEAMKHLFQPFFRAAVRPSKQGLGLGLYIASEIARAHGGTLDVTSTPAETCFTFRMPLRDVEAPAP